MTADSTPAATAARFLLERLQSTCGSRWRGGLRRQALAYRGCASEIQLIAKYQICRLPLPAARALVGWANGERDTTLRRDIPSPQEMLRMQAEGTRCVSLLDRPDGFDFAVHDLCHLEKFGGGPSYAGQVGFFASLLAAQGLLWTQLEAGLDDTWRHQVEHVMVDMNGAPLFLFCALKYQLKAACQRQRLSYAEREKLLYRSLQFHEVLVRAAESFESKRDSESSATLLTTHFHLLGERRLRLRSTRGAALS